LTFGSRTNLNHRPTLTLSLTQVADLHWVVTLGALHAPFWFVHTRTKGTLIARSRTHTLLPTRAIPSGGAASAHASVAVDSWNATMRKQRLKYFAVR
jgi:hypothetical protein